MRPGAKSPGLVLVGAMQCNDNCRGYVIFVIRIGGVIEPYGRDGVLTVLVEPLRSPKQRCCLILGNYAQLSVQLVMLNELNTLSNARFSWIRHLSFSYLASFCAARSMNSGRVNASRHQPSVRHCSGDGCGSVRLVIAKPDLRSSSV